MTQTNFLIGRGELLTHDIKGPRRKPGKKEAYTLPEAVSRLSPQFATTASELDQLPSEACPADMGVARLLMNPGYIARSYFPVAMLQQVGLQSIGSRTVKVTPEKWTKKGAPRNCSTTELFVTGKRSSFRRLNSWAKQLVATDDEAIDLARVERFTAFSALEKVVAYATVRDSYFEVGLQLPAEERTVIQSGFVSYAEKLGLKIYSDLSFGAGNLLFVPVRGEKAAIDRLAAFSFVRIIRPVPKLRAMRPVARASGIAVPCNLPTEGPLSSEPKVAILDGGLPKGPSLAPWVRSYRVLDEKAADDPEGPPHGLGVTSAFLFGPLTPNGTADRPFSFVDHLRVLDADANTEDPLELYRTLGFVEEVLLSRQYQFVNLSLGPDLPIEDTDVHAWTSVIDDLLSDGETLMTVAVGNNGERDHASGNARVQVPSDCVNALAVGAASDTETGWGRAPYSAIGPGRSPGVVKPDLMAFGGSGAKYFHTLTPAAKPSLAPQLGTSFAAPYLLRSAVGIRAILGTELSPLAIKALLVHSADAAVHDKLHVGWGKVPEDLMSIITCPTGVARIVYQGELKPGKYLRAPLPIPNGGLTGRIQLAATFCYASPTDPQDTAAYTRAGLEVAFRPNADSKDEDQQHADTKGFFDFKKYSTEAERRSDLGKWETVLHGAKNMNGSTLNNPVFDIHYNAREGGASTGGADKIRYALIITVKAPKHSDLYNDILRSYAKTLVPIQPQVALPIRLR